MTYRQSRVSPCKPQISHFIPSPFPDHHHTARDLGYVLKSNMRMYDQQRTQNRIRNGIQTPRRKWRQRQWDQARRHNALKTPVVAAMCVVGLGHGDGVVGRANDLLGQWRQDLLALRGVEGGALESWSQLLGERAVDGR